MAFSEEDRIVIEYLRQNQNYSAKRFIREFPAKEWKLGGLNALLRKIDRTGSCRRQVGRVDRVLQEMTKTSDRYKLLY